MWSEKNRLRLVNGVLLLFFNSYHYKAFFLQVIKKDFYENISLNQSSKEFTIVQNRAVIADRNGTVISKNKRWLHYMYFKQVDDPISFVSDLKKHNVSVSRKFYNRLMKKRVFSGYQGMWI